MPLNGEERMQQAEYEKNRKHFARPTEEQLKIALLEEQWKHTKNSLSYYQNKVVELERDLNDSQSTINHLNDHIDKQTEKLDQINRAIDLYVNGKRKEGVTLDSVIQAVEWKR